MLWVRFFFLVHCARIDMFLEFLKFFFLGFSRNGLYMRLRLKFFFFGL